MFRQSVCFFVFAIFPTSLLAGEVSTRLIAQTNAQVQGFPEGVAFFRPQLSSGILDRQFARDEPVIFGSFLVGGDFDTIDSSSFFVFEETALGSYAPVYSPGLSAPGQQPDVVLSHPIYRIEANTSGDQIGLVALAGQSGPFDCCTLLYGVDSGGPREALLTGGQAALGFDDGIFISALDDHSLQFNSVGDFVIRADLIEPSVSVFECLYYGNVASGAEVLFVEGGPVPEGDGSLAFHEFQPEIQMNDVGQLAFFADVWIPGDPTSTRESLLVGNQNQLDLLAQVFGEVPGFPAGVTFVRFLREEMRFNNQGQVIFLGRFQGEGITADNFDALFLYQNGTVVPIIQTGVPIEALGTNVEIAFMRKFSFNDAGQVVFEAELRGDTVNQLNYNAILLWDGGEITVLSREGQPAPVPGATVEYQLPLSPSINNAGEILFLAELNDGSYSLILRNASGEFLHLISTNEQLDVDPDPNQEQMEPIANILTFRLDQQGKVAYGINTFDGTDFIFVSEVEPSCSLPGDLTGDGSVNGGDIAGLISCLIGPTPECDCADVNGDGAINATDINAYVLSVLQ